MTLLRCFLFALYIFALYMAFAASSFAQERGAQLPDGPDVQGPGGPATNDGGSITEVRPPSLEGRKARLALLSQISSKSPSGSSFMAKLQDAVEVGGQPVLPAGTLVEGHLETIPARRMMRRGALRMIFDRVKLPDGTVQPARFELTATETKSAKTDYEGTVHPTVSKKRLAIQLGGTAMVPKLADDVSEEALATTAGSARWYGLAASTTFLLLQKGREVAQAGRGNRSRFCEGRFDAADGNRHPVDLIEAVISGRHFRPSTRYMSERVRPYSYT
jgi:hypothetical protein